MQLGTVWCTQLNTSPLSRQLWKSLCHFQQLLTWKQFLNSPPNQN